MADSPLRKPNPDPPAAETAINCLRRRLIFYFAHRFLSQEAEDLAQETLLRVLEKMPNLMTASEKDFKTEDVIKFAFKVAGHIVQEGRRRQIWGARTEGFPEGIDSDERFSSRQPDPEASVLAKEPWELVHACLRTLPEPRRKLVLSWFLDEKTEHKKMAQLLGTNPNGLRLRIFHSLESVRECVRKRTAKQRA